VDDIQTQSNKDKYICIECKNENIIEEDKKLGDVVECEFCGIEYKLIEQNDDGNFVLELLEEEK
jgi:DNA-directed RNA polymerase subunit RPC12/RpoP